jgi:type I site-specific restriction-modification system R (restriction) subunit
VREADAILLEMQTILDKMLEMATYKELVERLRKLIEQQDALNKETKQRQVDNLKNLIEE